MKREFEKYPKYRDNYIKAFDKMLIGFKGNTSEYVKWETGLDVYKWWVGDDPNQLTLFDDYF